MERLNAVERDDRNTAARIKVLKDELDRLDRVCGGYKDSGDRGACYHYNGYYAMYKEHEQLMAVKNSKNTAIGRKQCSVPMKYIRANAMDLWHGTRLDYGCGRGYDADFLRMDKFDPHYFPVWPDKTYDLVTCNYVLNVLPKELERGVIRGLVDCLNDTGTCFITVRRDIKTEGLTKRGTYQRQVELPFKRYVKKAGFEIYETNKAELKEYLNENK